jgi:eukaryotic-like serine/threonine-protein kinase
MMDSADGQSLELALQVEETCARFEAEWKAGRRPQFADYLGSANETLYQYLLQELVHLDVYYRQRIGETPRLEDYRNYCLKGVAPWLAALFPGQPDQVCSTAGPAAGATRHGAQPDGPETPRRGPAWEPSPGSFLGDYELLEEIGRGGMGVVYKARQRQLKRLVALKMILHGDFADPKAQPRLRREAEAIARLQHPNIVQVYEIAEHEGKPFFSLEYCSGGSLQRKLNGTPQPAREAAGLVVTLARAVQAAHDKQVIHRDLKPANVLLTEDGTLKIADFGMAKKLDDAPETASGAVFGTPSYMAPEQANGKNKDLGPACDVYALGAILYELLTGRPPFKAATILDTLIQVTHDEPVAPKQLQPTTPRDLETVCLKCLSKEPHKRYATAQAFADDLERWLSGRPILARPVGAVERTYRWCRQNPVVAGLVGGIVMLLVGITIASLLAVERFRQTELVGRHKLWEAYLSKADALRKSGQRGQRFESLRAIKEALKLPVPPGRSVDELREAAIAALCLPDIELGPEFSEQSEDPEWQVKRERTRQWKRLPEPKFNLRGQTHSPDGRFVLVGLEKYELNFQQADKFMTVPVRLWQVDGDEPKIIFEDQGVFERASAFRPDSRQLALGHRDGSLTVYDTETAGKFLNLSVKDFLTKKDYGPPCCLAFHRSLPRLAVGAGNAVLLFDVGSGRLLQQLIHPDGVSGLAWRPNGRQLATGCGDGHIYLWDTETGRKVTAPWSGHGRGGILLSFNQAGDRVVSNDWDAILRFWDAHTGREVFSTPEEYYVYYADSSSPGMLAPIPTGSKFHLLRVAEGQELRQLFSGAAYHWDNNRLHAFESAEALTFLDLASGDNVAVVPLKQPGGVMGFDGSGGMWTMTPDRAFWCWPVRPPTPDLPAYQVGPPEKVFDCPAEVRPGWSKDGQVVAIPQGSKGTLVLFREKGGKTVALEPQFDVRYCAVSPDGRWVAQASHWNDYSGAMIKISEAASGRSVGKLPTAKAYRLVGFSPDGRWLATAPGYVSGESGPRTENFLRLWKVGTWEECGTIPTVGLPYWDQDVVLEGQSDGGLTMTQISTGRQLARLASPEKGRVTALSLQHLSGFVIAAGDHTGTQYIWDLPLIRRQLAEMGLDWEGPPYFSPAQMKLARSPYTVRVDAGELAK